ncbi:S-layer family protein [Anabaena cylindrica FACHB-243]|uniref:Filamentous hemagglutinin family outer membrane protein n=1 Tax=Anabaena cylindrica (strain ATCC 27899 / PCC 7122) TaxID=272123 RepID=K9ZD74_ANACC|nr:MULTISPECIES: S-layer family protein [Anabaena]AFZ56310.1 filamentous hemagglutinin family outer membrane protein [Anabaena cylindrica PCC 7122]MBD2417541.1 S-layer family protein [Anabaena cylindrica FACHB-243]MBY5283715.1 S-layer family protein [Anabaena sp. CCAP 1446/1C]MBY5311007.1 S-layer family protein [Anabaena sp. CCAP 1446/1C]MCM2407711.1 S-layer family protein [Anabaena sp. CCAP 1446/1C]
MRVRPFLLMLTTGLLTPEIMLTSIFLWSCGALAKPTVGIAQVTSDGTTNTIVNPNGNNFNILNGIEKGNNLFHSFSNFSVPTGGSATFDLTNTPNITTIFSRVTGGNISHIDGLIQTLNGNNPASLFLMNPNGIVFGQNASLNIGGSFVGTTANSIKFADGIEFSAVTANTTPLLTMSVPIGLQFGGHPGTISVEGTGHNHKLNGTSPVSGLTSSNGLNLSSEKTLALVGGDLFLNSSFLSAPGGRIELGSITQGNVNINLTSQALTLSYPHDNYSFGNIQMSQRAVASVRGTTPGSIQIQGKQINLLDGSLVVVQNLGSQTAGDITINATESLQVIGMSSDFQSSSGIVNETLQAGAAGNIAITTPKLTIDQGAIVINRTYNSARSGNIVVKANEVSVGGIDPANPSLFPIFGVLMAATYGSGHGGDLWLSTDRLTIFGGGNVGTRSFATGNGGNVNINADTVQVSSLNTLPGSLLISLLSANTFSSGDAGNLQIDTRTLSIQDGGLVSVSTINIGNAGNLTINATNSIDVGGMKDPQNPSYIGAVARLFTIGNRDNRDSTAKAGSVTINTPKLTIHDGGRVFVQNEVLGDAGILKINANTLHLDKNASLLASTKVGEGGNIELHMQDILLMRHGSFINAEAGGSGNGGNIKINAPNIVGLENSDIIANAVNGKGGNIDISTQGIFGLQFRDQLTFESDITASSQFGINGTVDINNFGVDPSSGLVELPENVTDSSQQIATGCSNNTGSSFVATGRGGVPQNPSQEVRSDVYNWLRLGSWSDIRDISAYRGNSASAQIPPSPKTLISATSWHRNPEGKIELVADQSPIQVQQLLTCAAVPKS